MYSDYSVNNEDIAFKFGIEILYIHLTYSGFLIIKILELWYLKKRFRSFGCQNWKKK